MKILLTVAAVIGLVIFIAGASGTRRQPNNEELKLTVQKIWAACEAEYPSDTTRKVACIDRMSGAYVDGIKAGR
jgi:hypothetical protein